MRRFSVVLALLALGLPACTTGPSNLPDPYAPAFVQRRIWLSADADRAVTDRVITFTGLCYPLVRGKGRLVLSTWPADTADDIYMESPTHDTLHRVAGSDTLGRISYIPVEFDSGGTVTGIWKLRLPVVSRIGDYSFGADAMLDSVFVPDSGRYLPYLADVVRRRTPSGAGYDRFANSLHLISLYR